MDDFYKFMGMDRVVAGPNGCVQVSGTNTASLTFRLVVPGVLAGALIVSPGTGVTSGDNVLFPSKTTASVTLNTLQACAEVQELVLQEQLAYVRHYLSLNMSEMARVLRVERPTVYSWMAGKAEPHSDNVERTKKIYLVAKAWRSMSNSAMGSLVNQSISDRSVVDLLSDETLNELEIRKTFKAIVPLVQARKLSRQKSPSALATELRFEKPSDATSQSLSEGNTFV